MFGPSSIACSSSTWRVRGCTGKTYDHGDRFSTAMSPRSRSGSVFASRCRVSAAYGSGNDWVARSRAIGRKMRVASAITSPTTSRLPPTPSVASCSAERSSGQRRSAEMPSTSIRFRSSGIERSNERSPASTCATGTWPAASAPASVEFVSPYTSTQSGRSRSTARAICGRIASASAVRRSSRYAGSESPSSSKKTADISASQCWPVCTTTSSIPAARSASESGPDLMN